MTYLDLIKERALNSESITDILSRYYQSAIEADLIRFENKFNRKFNFKPDKSFWIKAGEKFSVELALNDPYYVVFSVFYTEIIKEIYNAETLETHKDTKILEYGLSSLTREQFDYLVNRYYLCISDANDPDMDESIVQKFAFHNSFSIHNKNNIPRHDRQKYTNSKTGSNTQKGRSQKVSQKAGASGNTQKGKNTT
jgi:hypothetical protein